MLTHFLDRLEMTFCAKSLRIMNPLKAEACIEKRVLTLFVIIILFPFISSSQTDTLPTHGTIKIAKHNDSCYIKAYTNFRVYLKHSATNTSYMDFVRYAQNAAYTDTNKIKVIDTRPKMLTGGTFDFTTYFKHNDETKNIKMRAGETDTVRFWIFVSNKGKVQYMEASPVQKIGKESVIYNEAGEYKVDVCHAKTKDAFAQLVNDNWIPAKLYALKTHPSKRKNKYKISNAYSEGILSVVYSSAPFED